jgi:6-phosphogluconolactonase
MNTRIRLFAAVALSLGLSGIQVRADAPAPRLERFYIGTYSGAIYQSTLSLGTQSFGASSVAVRIGDPSFVALTPDRRFLYAVNEGGGTVGAFSVNPTNGTLIRLNQRSSNGGSPAHVVVDSSGRNVIVAAA